jgi:hypothetical protein
MTRGRVLRAIADHDGAIAAMREALELYTRKGNVVSAARARSALDAGPARSRSRRRRSGPMSHTASTPRR